MPNSMDTLRLGTALVHSVPGSSLTVRAGAKAPFVVANHPAATCCPARWRGAIAGSFASERPMPSDIEIEMVGGRLAAGLGCFHDLADEEARWFAVTLPACLVATVCEELMRDVGVDVTLTPDTLLAVTVVRVRSNDPQIDDVVVDLRSRLAVAELAYELCA